MTPTDLTAALDALGMTQAQLADALGRSKRQVWRWIAGEYPVPHWAAWEIARLAEAKARS